MYNFLISDLGSGFIPGLLPTSATVQSLLPQNPSTLVPLPAHHHNPHQHHAPHPQQQQPQHHQVLHGHHPQGQGHGPPQPQPHHRIQQTVATHVTNNSTTTILPPTLLNRQMFSRTGLPTETIDG